MPDQPTTRRPHRWARHIVGRYTRSRLRDDRGAMSLFVAVVAVALFAIAGLVIDGGGKMRAAARADSLAQEAARSGGQALDPTQAVPGTALVLNPQGAIDAADHYLADTNAVRKDVHVSSDNTTLTVDVTITYHPVMLSLFGADTMTVTGHAQAKLVYGVTGRT